MVLSGSDLSGCGPTSTSSPTGQLRAVEVPAAPRLPRTVLEHSRGIWRLWLMNHGRLPLTRRVRTSDLLQGGEMGRPAGHWSLRLSPLARPCQSVTAPLQAATPLLSSLLKDLLPVSSHFHIFSLFPLPYHTQTLLSSLPPKEYTLTAHLLALSTNLPAAKA